ncbi:MAG: hypothetical protein SGJ20_09925 [Planctomycetota bacterium]|nr:hypothetical protein [Planctomycetota bacterium]
MAYLPVGFLFAQQYGVTAWSAAAIAAALCWVCSIAALVLASIAHRLAARDASAGMAYVLLGMLIRMGIPFAVGMAVSTADTQLSRAGFFPLVLVFYLITLVAETILSVMLPQERTAPVGTGSAATEPATSREN